MHGGEGWREVAPKHHWGVFVTREHVRHNKSGIAHRGRTRINHLRELPTRLNQFAAVGRLPCPAEPVNHRCTFGYYCHNQKGRLTSTGGHGRCARGAWAVRKGELTYAGKP
jgi:hypothetical protein